MNIVVKKLKVFGRIVPEDGTSIERSDEIEDLTAAVRLFIIFEKIQEKSLTEHFRYRMVALIIMSFS